MVPLPAPSNGDTWFLTIARLGDEDCERFVVAGRLGTAGAAQLLDALSRTAASGRAVVLDFEQVDYVSGAGCLAVEALAKAARKAGGTVTVVNATESVRICFELAGLDAAAPPPDR